ncbi:hypothetical protein B0H10DRAFT_2190094 [Mycena sp. CBHHK59/15]|nr:hypothetical protein B0H10DRAFT_2190094 [Mycena sp. CBHHK59/15]
MTVRGPILAVGVFQLCESFLGLHQVGGPYAQGVVHVLMADCEVFLVARLGASLIRYHHHLPLSHGDFCWSQRDKARLAVVNGSGSGFAPGVARQGDPHTRIAYELGVVPILTKHWDSAESYSISHPHCLLRHTRHLIAWPIDIDSPIPLSAADSWMEHDYPWLPSVSTDTSTLPTGQVYFHPPPYTTLICRSTDSSDVHYDYGLHAARMIHHLRDVVTLSPVRTPLDEAAHGDTSALPDSPLPRSRSVMDVPILTIGGVADLLVPTQFDSAPPSWAKRSVLPALTSNVPHIL